MPAIVVAGDLTLDYHLAQGHPASLQSGGAALIAGILEKCALPVLRPTGKEHAQSHALWAPFEDAWRVRTPLGVAQGEQSASTLSVPPETGLLVVDDAGLGFRQANPVLAVPQGTWVIAKVTAPIIPNPLLDHLARSHAQRLVVIITANDLRHKDVHLSRDISWERTAEDLAWEFTYNDSLAFLRSCRCVIISFPAAGAFVYQSTGNAETHDLIFDPTGGETDWLTAHPGEMIGYTATLTAAVARVLFTQPDPSFLAATQSGLHAMRRLHQRGYLMAPNRELRFPFAAVAQELLEPPAIFKTVSVPNPAENASTRPWTILDQIRGTGFEAMARKIVTDGTESVTSEIPFARFGGLVLIDRAEIESYRGVAALLKEYTQREQSKPVSIAVFGPPGSGKSFGVKQLAKSLAEVQPITFNLSQFQSPADLVHALHRVRDVGLSGKLPLVFWDEFDVRDASGRPFWLPHFLAPMQDGEFQEGEIAHPIGRAIFVFAGGIAHTMEKFTEALGSDSLNKGPDFISRLRGYVDVAGPDPRTAAGDEQALVRRAVLLRGIIGLQAAHLIIRKQLDIDPGVLRALLHVSSYRHGVRSMESIVLTSVLAGKRRFERSCLPPGPQLDLHVDAREFQALVRQIEFTQDQLEGMAGLLHEYFLDDLPEGERAGHSSNLGFADLPADEREQNLAQARDIPFKLARVGCVAVPRRSNEQATPLTVDEIERLSRDEHDRWVARKKRDGWSDGPETIKTAKIHRDIKTWDELDEKARDKDRRTVSRMADVLDQIGFVIVRIPPSSPA